MKLHPRLARKTGWTAVDDELMRISYADTPTKDLAKILGRPIVACYNRARTLGLKKAPELFARMARENQLARSSWTDADKAYLRVHYPNVKTLLIARELGKTLRAVYAQAAKLRLKKSAGYLASTDSGRLNKILGVINSAKVEVEHMKLGGQASSVFIAVEAHPNGQTTQRMTHRGKETTQHCDGYSVTTHVAR